MIIKVEEFDGYQIKDADEEDEMEPDFGDSFDFGFDESEDME